MQQALLAMVWQPIWVELQFFLRCPYLFSIGDLNDTDHDLELLLEKRRAELIAKQDKDQTAQGSRKLHCLALLGC